MKRFMYWLKKSLKWSLKQCSKFCPTCKYYEICRDEDASTKNRSRQDISGDV